ncbi:MAG: TetR/AcrR family transcriptional regulator, lmrAB and yxaGH operons repressor [Chloroflexota bacterium]|jgi:AcrR family transcriptional regulator|nr:TetR/AcrR family transcriptional regulator, lmrAB and yxaGH operons repressor [Chloroflexota bacterium]
MIAGAMRLLARRGLQATSFSEVLELTGAPRGSIYHHFPEGKDQLVAAAIALAGDRALQPLEEIAGAPAEEIATLFLGMWRKLLTHANFDAGCSVLAVTVATDSRELLDRAGNVFRSWRGRLAELLEQGGLSPVDARRLATTLVAASEGAVVLSRAERSMEPFELVSSELLDQVRGAVRSTRPKR